MSSYLCAGLFAVVAGTAAGVPAGNGDAFPNGIERGKVVVNQKRSA